MQNRIWDRILLFLQWLIAAIFIFAGISKIINPGTFVRDVDNYRLLPYLLVTIIAIILPWVEILCGIFLIAGKWKKGTAFSLLVLTFIFLIAISTAIARGLDITCGCFSNTVEGIRLGYTRLIEDVILFVLAGLIYMKSKKDQ